MSEQSAKVTVLIDNDHVRVMEWRFAPGEVTGHHRHERRYVVVPMSTGELLIRDADGERPNPMLKGVPYYRDSGAEHNVVNANDFEFAFIEVEIK